MEPASPSSPSLSNVSEILKLKNDFKKTKENQLRLEIAVPQISRQFSEVVGNMVVICMDLGQGRNIIEEEMNQVSELLKSLNDKIEVMEADEDKIGSVLMDIMTIGGMIKRLKFKNATTSGFDADAAVVETATSRTTNGNEKQEAKRRLRRGVMKWSEESSETDSFIDDDEDDSGEDDSEDDSDEDDDVASIEAEKLSVNMAPSSPASLAGSRRTRSMDLLGPAMSTSMTSAPTEPLSANASTSGKARRRSGRLEKIPPKNYAYRDYDQSIKDHVKSVNKRESRRPTTPPKTNLKKKQGTHVCPNSQCGERFSNLKGWTAHLVGHARKDVGPKCDRRSLKRHKKDDHGAGGESSVNDGEEIGLNEMAVVEQPDKQDRAVGVSVTIKRPKLTMKTRSTPTIKIKVEPKTEVKSENDNHDSSVGCGEAGTATGPAVGEAPRVKVEPE